ncbi:MAG: ABC transporter ATP-binding protein [Acidimicrobiia bacterium]
MNQATSPVIDAAAGSAVVVLGGVGVCHGERWVLRDLHLTISTGEHWVVLGPNGSGKTTLVQILSLYRHPSVGTVDVLGQRLGRGMDVRTMRTRIGLASPSLAQQLRAELPCRDVVMTARHAALEPWWHRYDDADRAKAVDCLARVGCEAFAERSWSTLSSGERQRVLLARTLMTDPAIVLLDEPTAGLDLPGREQLVSTLAALASDPIGPPTVLVTHHVEEIAPGTTHALLLRNGEVIGAGDIDQVLTESALSETMGCDVELRRHRDRWSATAR